ncbi:MAG: ABC transporter ATP-binding protein [Gammaproteobacteria bacterium]|nr:ABC transporter ATP-binding protein [Gammaproteobacteria bacterium]MCK5262289.1 ABC transporter ATP-binding protein [Gammaproteobacteria bacterium]
MSISALTIKNLKKTYRNGTEALCGVDLDVQEGDFFALLGPNGAGKSTTIGIISSLVNKTSGSAQVFGHDIDTDSATARSLIGLVPQEHNFNIFEPVGEILINQAGFYGIGRHVATQRAEKYLRKLELWDKRFEMAKELSGGMKRRLMIARALVHEPKLLILDEPTAGVDIEIRHSMWEFMREMNACGTTIILTTHYLEEAESLCNHIAIIDKGVTIEHTSMRKLLDRLHIETFVLYLENGINELPVCGDYQLKLIDSNTIEADIAHTQSLNELFQILSNCNVKVLSMRNKTNRLEQLFVSMMRKGNADNYNGGES